MAKHFVRTSRPGGTRRPQKRRRPAPPARENKSQDLSSLDVSKMISGFYTLRSTLKDLSSSLQRLESIMDNAYSMFEIANHLVDRRRTGPRFRPPLRLIKPSRKTEEEEDIPQLNLPPLEDPPGEGPQPSFDLSQVMKILQSPFVKQLINELLQAKTSDIDSHAKQKQG
ncbi:hypothetical protein SAMN04488112_10885 [Melghirimyces thermohalophilus]|uniref:Uncharacterized protein n=1 Tax=Melghirimyces thermohalophilus TaxID=1236220 RepID=A0A1G6LR95_9BACL|nr:hypothetical protein [Melghirimyces thermohalophilus]SDC45607.1 hypothetical protein SAMN04488112_10885 [Melghirimyces thermohalophilus]